MRGNVIFFFYFIIHLGHTQVPLNQEVLLTNNTFDNRYASYSKDGERIVFESNRDGNWEIYLMDRDGQNQTRLTFNTAEDRRPSWHPDGNRILFESDRTGMNHLYTYDLQSKRIEKLPTPEYGEPVFASYSPDGRTIAFSLKISDETSDLILMDMNSKSNPWKKLISNGFRNFYPQWSPDGKVIAFFSRKDTENQIDDIYTINIYTKQITRVTELDKHSFCPSFSRDAKQLAFVNAMEKSRPELFVIDVSGENLKQITDNRDGDTLPCWSTDDKKILFTGYRQGSFQICEITLDQ
ncbi:MAG: hypothetical protein AAF554_04080 [Bacteroidota bacterium]